MKVSFFKSYTPICYNLEKWNIAASPLLLVTGLSGSGKTTFARKFAIRHNSLYISFDALKFYSEASMQSKEIMDIFLKKHPNIKKNIDIQWAKTDNINSNDILFNYYCNVFFDFLIEYSKQINKKIVLEGIQMFVRLHPSKSIGLPVIIIRSSSIKCIINKFKRDYCQSLFISKGKLINHLINDIYTYHIKQKRLLNKYILYLSILYKNNYNGG